MKIYEKKEQLRKEFKILQQEYLFTDNFNKYLKLKEKEDSIYKKYVFFKEFLNARGKINER